MPKDYAKRFAKLIAADPDIEADYAIQLYDLPFAYQVAKELEKLGFHPHVDGKGMLTLHQPGTRENPQSNTSGSVEDPPQNGNITHCRFLRTTRRRAYRALPQPREVPWTRNSGQARVANGHKI